MKINERSWLYVARCQIEAESGFMLSTGSSDSLFDNLIVRDANGLPTIPGTTLAGVLRHRYESWFEKHPGESTQDLFGYAESENNGSISAVAVSFALIHDSTNSPVERRVGHISDDYILERLIQSHPLQRDRVKINNRGVASDQAKFDTTLAPKGCRFTFEIRLWSQEENSSSWDRIMDMLRYPIHLGRGTRSGYGKFSTVVLKWECFNLKDDSGWKRFCRLPGALAGEFDFKHVVERDTEVLKIPHTVTVSMDLEPEDYWRFGQTGTPTVVMEHSPDDTVFTEPVIHWGREDSGKGDAKANFDVERRMLVIPASGLKGAISHRVLYHYHRLECMASEDSESWAMDDEQTRWERVVELFGDLKANVDDEESGRAGILTFEDVYLDFVQKDIGVMQHNSIDRFTGGTIDGALFSEELIWKTSFTLRIHVDLIRGESISSQSREALHLALKDLAEGRLSLGAASSRGHGYFSCPGLDWSDGGKWINVSPRQEENSDNE